MEKWGTCNGSVNVTRAKNAIPASVDVIGIPVTARRFTLGHTMVTRYKQEMAIQALKRLFQTQPSFIKKQAKKCNLAREQIELS